MTTIAIVAFAAAFLFLCLTIVTAIKRMRSKDCKFCENCGHKNNAAAKFCGGCGETLENTETGRRRNTVAIPVFIALSVLLCVGGGAALWVNPTETAEVSGEKADMAVTKDMPKAASSVPVSAEAPAIAETAAADPKASAYAAYYELLKTEADKYGVIADGYELNYGAENVVYAGLVDFDNNGLPEFVLCCGSNGYDRSYGEDGANVYVEVYGYDDISGKTKLFYESEYYYNFSRSSISVSISRAADGSSYLIFGDSSYGMDGMYETAYYTLKDSAWEAVLTLEEDGSYNEIIYKIDGVNVTKELHNGADADLGLSERYYLPRDSFAESYQAVNTVLKEVNPTAPMLKTVEPEKPAVDFAALYDTYLTRRCAEMTAEAAEKGNTEVNYSVTDTQYFDLDGDGTQELYYVITDINESDHMFYSSVSSENGICALKNEQVSLLAKHSNEYMFMGDRLFLALNKETGDHVAVVEVADDNGGIYNYIYPLDGSGLKPVEIFNYSADGSVDVFTAGYHANGNDVTLAEFVQVIGKYTAPADRIPEPLRHSGFESMFSFSESTVLYSEYLDSRAWESDVTRLDENEFDAAEFNAKILSSAMFDFDGDGVDELWFESVDLEAGADPSWGGYPTLTGFCTVSDGKVKPLLVTYDVGAQIGGWQVTFRYSTELSRHVVLLKGQGRYSPGDEYYVMNNGELTLIESLLGMIDAYGSTHQINGVDVTEAEYDAAVSKYTDPIDERFSNLSATPLELYNLSAD